MVVAGVVLVLVVMVMVVAGVVQVPVCGGGLGSL